MKLVFTGIQGCGKGTQARLLVEEYGFTHLEMGGEFRKIVASGSELGNILKALMDAGKQITPELWVAVMEEVLQSQTSENIIFDGFIRNDWNKDVFDRILPNYQVVFFDLSIEKAKTRLLGRMFDSKTGETFLAWTTHNSVSGDLLVKRDDDKDEAAILQRISEFETKTLPIVDIQKKENKVISVNADQAIADVTKEIISKLAL